MKRSSIILFWLISTLTMSCQKEQELDISQIVEVHEYTISTGSIKTKTSLGNGASLLETWWATDDTLSVFGGQENENIKFSLQDGAGSPRGIFKGKLAGKVTNLQAIYPYTDVSSPCNSFLLSIQNQNIDATSRLPLKEQYGKYAYMAAVPVSVSGDQINMSFEHVMSRIVFSLTNSTGTPIHYNSIQVMMRTMDGSLLFRQACYVDLTKDITNSSSGFYKTEEAILQSGIGMNYLATPTGTNIQLSSPLEISMTLFPVNLTGKQIAIDISFVDKDGIQKVISIEKPGKNFERSKRYTASLDISSLSIAPTFVDEKGVDRGKAVFIGDNWWAPVNCGYEPVENSYKGYPYGKMYQWGRKVGQGYNQDDATVPTVHTTPLAFELGINEPADGVIYGKHANGQWTVSGKQFGWYSGTAPDNVDTYNNLDEAKWGTKIGNPCPIGWQVPSLDEYYKLFSFGHIEKVELEVKGLWLGLNREQATSERPNGCVFMPYVGRREGTVAERGSKGIYWANNIVKRTPNVFIITNTRIYNTNLAAYGCYGIRCIKTN